MTNIDIKMEYSLYSLSYELKRLCEYPEYANFENIMKSLGSSYMNCKKKSKRKKSKKEYDERGAIQELTKVLESMIVYSEKYNNVKKNLSRVSDKVDSADMLYSACNPLLNKQINMLLESLLRRTPSESLEIIAIFYERMLQICPQIQQAFSSILDSVYHDNFAYKIIIYVLLISPDLIPILMRWESYIQKDNAQTSRTLSYLLKMLKTYGLLEMSKQTNEKALVEQSESSYPDEQEPYLDDDRFILELSKLTPSKQRPKPYFDQEWLHELQSLMDG